MLSFYSGRGKDQMFAASDPARTPKTSSVHGVNTRVTNSDFNAKLHPITNEIHLCCYNKSEDYLSENQNLPENSTYFQKYEKLDARQIIFLSDYEKLTRNEDNCPHYDHDLQIKNVELNISKSESGNVSLNEQERFDRMKGEAEKKITRYANEEDEEEEDKNWIEKLEIETYQTFIDECLKIYREGETNERVIEIVNRMIEELEQKIRKSSSNVETEFQNPSLDVNKEEEERGYKIGGTSVYKGRYLRTSKCQEPHPQIVKNIITNVRMNIKATLEGEKKKIVEMIERHVRGNFSELNELPDAISYMSLTLEERLDLGEFLIEQRDRHKDKKKSKKWNDIFNRAIEQCQQRTERKQIGEQDKSKKKTEEEAPISTREETEQVTKTTSLGERGTTVSGRKTDGDIRRKIDEFIQTERVDVVQNMENEINPGWKREDYQNIINYLGVLTGKKYESIAPTIKRTMEACEREKENLSREKEEKKDNKKYPKECSKFNIESPPRPPPATMILDPIEETSNSITDISTSEIEIKELPEKIKDRLFRTDEEIARWLKELREYANIYGHKNNHPPLGLREVVGNDGNYVEMGREKKTIRDPRWKNGLTIDLSPDTDNPQTYKEYVNTVITNINNHHSKEMREAQKETDESKLDDESIKSKCHRRGKNWYIYAKTLTFNLRLHELNNVVLTDIKDIAYDVMKNQDDYLECWFGVIEIGNSSMIVHIHILACYIKDGRCLQYSNYESKLSSPKYRKYGTKLWLGGRKSSETASDLPIRRIIQITSKKQAIGWIDYLLHGANEKKPIPSSSDIINGHDKEKVFSFIKEKLLK